MQLWLRDRGAAIWTNSPDVIRDFGGSICTPEQLPPPHTNDVPIFGDVIQRTDISLDWKSIRRQIWVGAAVLMKCEIVIIFKGGRVLANASRRTYVRQQPCGCQGSLQSHHGCRQHAYDSDVQMINCTSVRVHQHAANSKKPPGSLYGPLARRADDQNPRCHRHARPAPRTGAHTGPGGDCPVVASLLGHLRPDTILLADKAYDADWLR
jgi:hypothetical protein